MFLIGTDLAFQSVTEENKIMRWSLAVLALLMGHKHEQKATEISQAVSV